MPPGTRNALVPPSPNYLQNAGQFVGGVGRGLSNQFVTGPLELVQQSYYDPYALGQGVVQGVAQFAQDPVGAVGNSLRSMWNRAKSSPAGLGEVVGENIDPRNWLKPRKAMRKELDVYHGTPHTFDPETNAPLGQFRSSKIGTGEGAQMYGYGLYFAESPGVAKTYRTVGTDESYRRVTGGMNPMEEYAYDLASQGIAGEDLFSRMHQRYGSQLKTDKQFDDFDAAIKMAEKSRGNVYKVDLPDSKIEQMLDWDKPLSQQPKSILSVAQSVATDVPDGIVAEILREEGIKGFASGGDLYRSIAQDLGSDSYASQALLTEGKIPGIKYLDAGSRGSKKRTRNFVVFPGEEQHLNILSRD